MTTLMDYARLTKSLSNAIEFEDACLSIDREYLPEVAISVLDGNEPTPEYWEWLIEQVTLCNGDTTVHE